MNLRSRLLILIFSVLVPAFVAGGVAVAFVFSEERAAQERALSEAARVLAQLVDTELTGSESFLRALAAAPSLREDRLERFYLHARGLSNNDRNTIILSGLDGMQVFNTRLPWGAPPRTINPRLLELRRSGDPRRTVVSDLFFSPLGQRHDIAVQIPVEIDGSVRYYLSRGLAAAEFQRFLIGQGFSDNWIASIVDRNGVVVARSRHGEAFVGKAATGPLAAKISQGLRHGINLGESLEGTPVKAYFHRAPKSEWTVILSVPVAELNAPARRAALLLTVLIAFILIVALVLTQRYMRRILAPIRRLRDDAQRLGQGQGIVPFASGVAELDVVNATLVQAHARLRTARTDMERRIAEAIESTERAQRSLLRSQKLEAIGRLTGGVAHDFNNVLQTLTAALQLIGLEPDPAKIPDRMAVCKRAIARATALVSQLRTFGQTQDAYLETVAVDQAVAAVLPMLKNALPAGIDLDTRIDEGVGAVDIDVTQFELALLNLVINGRDAIDSQGRITLHVRAHTDDGRTPGLAPGSYVRIDVADTGTGMPPEVLSKALDPFFTTKALDKGTGLGLPQAYGFALQSGGTLLLESELGRGTQVSIILPRLDPSAPTAVTHEEPQARAAAPIRGARLLFVDDDPLVRASVIPILEQAGATVSDAAGAGEALRLLDAGQEFDAMLSDVVMPGAMNGVMLALHVQARFPQTAIVLATGYFEEKVDLPGIRLLTKPYEAAEAIDALAAAMAARRRHS